VDLMAVLADLNPVDHRVTSQLGKFNPIGVIVHHTASKDVNAALPSLVTCQDGRAATATRPRLPGPLCNVLIGRNASVNVITDGRANDSGTGDPHVFEAFKARQPLPKPDDDDPHTKPNGHFMGGNEFFFDIEVENTGLGEPYPQAVVDTTAKVVAAICKANGFASDRVMLHKEWSRRKIDWSFEGDTRALVARFLEEDDMPSADEVAEAVLDRLNAEGTAFGLTGFGATVQHTVQLGRDCSVKLDQLLARQPGAIDVDGLATALAAELGEDLARQLGETLVRNSGDAPG
jgi:hypothetical protein